MQPASRPEFIFKSGGSQFEFGKNIVPLIADFSGIRINGYDLTVVYSGNVTHNGQSAGIFHSVEKDGGDQTSENNPSPPFVGNIRNILSNVPHERICGGFSGRSCPHHVSHKRNFESLFPEIMDGLNPAGKTSLPHRQGMQRYIRTAPSILGRGQVICIDFPLHFKHLDRQNAGNFRFG